MRKWAFRVCLSGGLIGLGLVGLAAQGADPAAKEALGERLFFDVNLSANRTQSCASCHDPEHGFADPRGMASPGDDGVSIGDRNAPTAMYAALTPVFHRAEDGNWVGGQFHDGRAATLARQAGGPPLDPKEMGMPDRASVVARLKQDPGYVKAFTGVFGRGILEDDDRAFEAMTEVIAAFEATEVFSPFTSKYDRFLRGEVQLSAEEEMGRLLFFSRRFTNCTLCHLIGETAMDRRETFTDYRYYNIGVPENLELRDMNGVAPGTIDEGLAQNPALAGALSARGKFRTPTLRNVAVTGPYMHNGVFEDLRTVLAFYNQFNSLRPESRINPETGRPFGMPQVMETLAFRELTHGPDLRDERLDAIVAFLKTLTDARYEHLLEPD